MLKNHPSVRFVVIAIAIAAFAVSAAANWGSTYGLSFFAPSVEESTLVASTEPASAMPRAMMPTGICSGTRNIPGDYADLATAIADINTNGVVAGGGGCTLNLLAGNPQTAPAGGYSINVLANPPSAADPLIITGSLNTITANGTLTVGALNDAIFKIIGTDFVTIQNFVMQENPANTTTTPASNNMTEWGVALLYASTTNGAQNNTIQNNSITLNRTYTNTFGIYSNVRHSPTAVTTTADITNNTTAPNSGNKVYNNIISNVNMGITFIGSGTGNNQDVGNDIGGGSAATGNAISNWGGAAAASGYVSNSGTSYCVFVNHQIGENVSFNTITSATVTGTAVTFVGIRKDFSVASPAGTFTANINNNTITMTSNFTSGTFQHILSQGLTALSTATININNNLLVNSAVTGASSASLMAGIVNSSAPGTLSITNNTIRGFNSTATSGGFTGISNSGAVVTAINLNNNKIGDATAGVISYSVATTGTITGITNTGGASTAALSMNGNDIRGIAHTVAASSTHLYLNNSTFTGASSINSNTFTNLNVNTTGNVTFISNSVTHAASTVHTVNSNSIVTAFNKGGAGGAVQFFISNGTSAATVTETSNGNNFSNVTVTGGTTIAGWQDSDGGSPVKTVTNNTFTNIAGGSSSITVLNCGFSSNGNCSGNTISNVSGTSSITGFTSTSGTQNISGNTISSLSTTGAFAVTGISITGGTTQNVFKNKIYDLQSNNASGTVNGILISSGTTVSAYNNLIGDLRTPAANAANPLIGLSITGGTTVNAYYNSIYLSGASTGALFGSSAVSVSTTPTVTLRNNVFVNASTTMGAGLAVAYRRSSTTLTTYAAASNNNDFFGSTIYTDGTNTDATIAAYKTRVAARDSASFSENPPFLSTSGASVNFLHISPVTPTQLESGGTAVTGITDDFDGQTRNATTPDVGADEFAGIPQDLTPPVISYTLLGNGAAVATRLFDNVTVTDGTGVNGTPGTRPRVYYKKGCDPNNTFNDNTNATAGWKFVEASGAASPFSFTINYALLPACGGGSGAGVVAVGDVVQYFVVAQDTVTPTPNVGINSGTFAVTPTSVALTAAAFPIGGTINSYNIVASLSGTKTVCAAGCDYSGLTTASGVFAAINSSVVTGNILVQITGDLTVEDGLNPLNAIAEEPTGSNFTVEIDPIGTPRNVTGTFSGALIRLNAADRVIIDGSNGGGGTSRDLTITNTNTGTSSAVVWLQSNGTDGAQNNVIKNLNIVGQANTTTQFGIGMGSSTISTTSLGNGNNNNTIQNNNISKTQYGIYSQGASAAAKNTGNIITQNLMNTVSPNNVAKGGIWVGFENNITISGNTVSEISQTSSPDVFGITLGFGTGMSATTSAGNEVTNATVSNNIIGNVVNSGTFSSTGIGLSAATSGTTTIKNNMIYGVSANGTSGDFGAGIVLGGGTGSTTNVYFNSVSMQGTVTGASAGTQTNACLAVTNSTAPTLNITNNIFSMTQLGNAGSTAKFINVALGYASTAGNYTGLTASNNDYFSSFTDSNYLIGSRGTVVAGTTFATLPLWQAETGRDGASVFGNPQFLSATDLHISTTLTTPVESAGVPIPGIPSDIDGDGRAGFPDIGADEGTFIAPVINDVQATAFIDPTNGGTKLAGAAFSPVASFTNNGLANKTNVPVRYRICVDVGCTSEVYNQTTIIPTLNSSATANATFASATLAAGTYTIKATSELFPDSVPANDEISGTLNVLPPFSGPYTVGTGGNYPSLTNNGGIFEAINALGATGNIEISILNDLTGELGTHALNELAGGYSVLIHACSPRTVTGSNAGALIRLNAADNVTIDGNPGSCGGAVVGGNPALRGLSIQNTSTSTSAWVISVASNGANGAQNNTIANVNLIGRDPTTTAGIVSIGGATPRTVATGPNLNNRVENCSLKRAVTGIYSAGQSSASPSTGSFIAGNETSAVAADRIRRVGIVIFNDNQAFIQDNSLSGISTPVGEDAVGIGVGTESVDTTSVTSGGVTNAFVQQNKINGVASLSTTGFSAAGIAVAGGTGGPNTLRNNMITGVTAPATDPDIVAGIYVVGAAGSSTRLYHNSIANTGDRGATAFTGLPSYGVAITGTDPTVEMKNNIFYTTQTASGGGANAKSYAVGMVTTTFVNLDSNYNDFWSTGANDGGFRSGSLAAAAGTDYVDLAAWRTATGGTATDDANSQELDPVYINPTNDLHLNALTTPLIGDGVLGFGSTDFDGDPRPVIGSTINPEVGADELVQSEAGSFPAGTFYNAIAAPNDQLGGSVSITNSITLNGILNTGNFNTLTLECNASFANAGPNNYVVGTVSKQYCSTGSFVYPVGTTPDNVLTESRGAGNALGTVPEYTPVIVNVTGGIFPSFLSARVFDAGLSGFDPTQSLSRNWELEELGDITADLSFTYLDGVPTDVNGTEANYIVYRRNANGTTDAMCLLACVDTTNNIIGPATGVTQFSRWSGAALVPTSAGVNVSGRVLTPTGSGLRNAEVTLTDSRGVTQTIRSTSFGNYRFEDVRAGETYVLAVNSRRFVFTPRVVQVFDEVTGLDLTADPEQ